MSIATHATRIVFVLTCISFLCNTYAAPAQFGDWAWIGGSNTVNPLAVYTSKGSPSAFARPGGRSNQANWIDHSGNLWIFGGHGYNAESYGRLSDMWMFNIATARWTWVGGPTTHYVPGNYGIRGLSSPENWPGSRSGAMTWVDLDNNLWLYGGEGNGESSSGYLCDLWVFDQYTLEWTWIQGSDIPNQLPNYGARGTSSSSNTPGSRRDAGTWIDRDGSLMMFGGYLNYGSSVGPLNDLWKYQISTGNWIWINGASQTHAKGTYGSLGVSQVGNSPGSRDCPGIWVDKDFNTWIFGGNGYGEKDFGFLSDLWKYDRNSNGWTWMKGGKVPNLEGSYGTQGVSNSSNNPGGRNNPFCFNSADGSLCLFAGNHGMANYYCDLWEFDTSNCNWVWVKGQKGTNNLGSYGILGVFSPINAPGSRNDSVAWLVGKTDIYLFGGIGYASEDKSGRLGDVWRLKLNSESQIDWNECMRHEVRDLSY